MSDTGTQAQPQNGTFEGTTSAKTPAQIAQEQAAMGFHAGTQPITPVQAGQNVQMNPAAQQQQGGRWTDEDIEKARREEREKLYPQLSKVDEMAASLAALQAEREQEREAREAAEAAAAEAERLAEEAKMSATALNSKRIDELAQQLAQTEAQRATELAIFEQERRLNMLQQYAQQAVQAAGNTIIPELWDMVTGNTEAEIDESIKLLQQKTANMVGQLQETMVAQRQVLPGTMPTAPAMGPLENQQGVRQISAEEIAAMTPQQFAQQRSYLLPAAGAAWRQQHGR